MAKKQKINLPLKLNKEKLLQKISTNLHGDIELTAYQKKLFEKELNRAEKVILKVQNNNNNQNKKINLPLKGIKQKSNL